MNTTRPGDIGSHNNYLGAIDNRQLLLDKSNGQDKYVPKLRKRKLTTKVLARTMKLTLTNRYGN